jgi:hypothetical protein
MPGPLTPLAKLLGHDLRRTVLDQAAAAGLAFEVGDPAPVTDQDLTPLPEPAQRFLRAMGVVGRPRDRSFVARLAGRFRRAGGPWMNCDAWQFNAVHPVARIFHIRLDMMGFVPMIGHDVYLDGTGSMHGKALGLVPVVDGEGDEFDVSELVTWLNDALVLAPSMLLDPIATWTPVNDHSFDIAVTDAGRTVTARVLVDDDDTLRDFSTDDRWADLPGGLVRARWTTPLDSWHPVDGRLLPGRGAAIWHFDDGPLCYVEACFVPGSVEYGLLVP